MERGSGLSHAQATEFEKFVLGVIPPLYTLSLALSTLPLAIFRSSLFATIDQKTSILETTQA